MTVPYSVLYNDIYLIKLGRVEVGVVGGVDYCKHRGMYGVEGVCKVDFHFNLLKYAALICQQTFPESQLLDAWPASIYRHLREWTFPRVHENAHKLKNYTTRVLTLYSFNVGTVLMLSHFLILF